MTVRRASGPTLSWGFVLAACSLPAVLLAGNDALLRARPGMPPSAVQASPSAGEARRICGLVAEPVFWIEGMDYRNPRQAHTVRIGSETFSTGIFSKAALGAFQIAHDTGYEVCIAAEYAGGEPSAAVVDASVEICGHPDLTWTSGDYLAIDGIMIVPAVLGLPDDLETVYPSWPNVMSLMGFDFGGNFNASRDGCLTAHVSGGRDDPAVTGRFVTAGCTIVEDRSTESITISRPIAGTLYGPAKLKITPDSYVDPTLVKGVIKPIRVMTELGLDGSIRVVPFLVPGCSRPKPLPPTDASTFLN
jgi:hypothetical protein